MDETMTLTSKEHYDVMAQPRAYTKEAVRLEEKAATL